MKADVVKVIIHKMPSFLGRLNGRGAVALHLVDIQCVVGRLESDVAHFRGAHNL